MDSKISKIQDSNNNLQRQASEASLDMSELFNEPRIEPTNRTNHDAKANVLSSSDSKIKESTGSQNVSGDGKGGTFAARVSAAQVSEEAKGRGK